MNVRLVDTRPHGSPFDEIFDTYIRTSTPVVLKGAAARWPCRTRWTRQYLRECFGNVVVEITGPLGETRRSTIRSYLDLSERERSDWYLTDWNFRGRHPELVADVRVPKHFAVDWVPEIPASQRPDLMWIYMGHAGTQGQTHRDNHGTSAWLAVLDGVKRVRFATTRGTSRTELARVDLFKDGELARAEYLLEEATLTAGDVLYVPAMKWHAARNDTYCLSLTANFVDGGSFVPYRQASARRWHGRRMLIRNMERLRSMPSGPERSRLVRHLSLAIDSQLGKLTEELDELHSFAEDLSQLRVSRS